MDTENKITDITKYINKTEKDEEKVLCRTKFQTNPIYKKNLIISIKNNTHKFSVNDLFD